MPHATLMKSRISRERKIREQRMRMYYVIYMEQKQRLPILKERERQNWSQAKVKGAQYGSWPVQADNMQTTIFNS